MSKSPGERQRVVRLLELDPDLGVDLDADSLASATAELAAPAATLDQARVSGHWGPAPPRGQFGLLVLEGLFLRDVQLLGKSSAEILGQGDLLRPWDADGGFTLPVPAETHWTELQPVLLAILDAEFVRNAARWPDVLVRLTGRAVVRASTLALNEAITNLKHVETRLLVQFWHLADRWGTVGPGGISIPVPLTHEMLAKVVGATRPSVTTGLGRLAARGLLIRKPDGVWQLGHDSGEALEPLPVGAETRLPS